MIKIDPRKGAPHLYNPSKSQFGMTDVPPMNFPMADGGDRKAWPAFHASYGLCHTPKLTSERQMGIDNGLLRLEGLWWVEDRLRSTRTTSAIGHARPRSASLIRSIDRGHAGGWSVKRN